MELYDEFGLGLGGESDLTSAPSSGIGIAPEQSPAPVASAQRMPVNAPAMSERDQILSKMSGGEKFFTALGEFGAGVTGRPSPFNKRVEEQRKQKLLQMEELKGSVSSLEHGIKLAEGLEGDKRKEFVDSYAGRLDEIQPGLGGTYRALSEKPGLLTQFQQYMPYLSQPMQVMLKSNPQGFLKFAGTAEGMKALEEAHSKSLIEGPTGAAKKMTTILSGLQQLAPPEMVEKFNKDGRISVAEIRQLNEHLKAQKSPAALTDEQMAAAEKAGDSFWTPLGVLSTKREGDVIEASAKEKKGMKPGTALEIPLGGKNYAKGVYDPDKSLFPQAEHDANGFAIIGKGTKEGMKVEFPATSSEVNRNVNGKIHKIKIQMSTNGEIRETDLGEVAPPPKESNPVKEAIAAAIAGKAPPKTSLGKEPKLPTVSNKEAFNALPAGAEFIDARDGKKKVKGK